MKHGGKIVTGLTILFSLFICCNSYTQFYEERGSVFGTTYHIKYKSSQLLTEKINAELRKINLSVNPFNTNSASGLLRKVKGLLC